MLLAVLSVHLSGTIPADERRALIAFYPYTGGPGWTHQEGWPPPPLDADGFALPGTEGSWFGVTVSNDHVVRIELSGNNLSGPIPDLSHLENLDQLLANLHTVDLSHNRLEGAIPPEMGHLVGLESLKLNSNHLKGEVPSQLTSLTQLSPALTDFGYNALTTTDPAMLTFLNTADPDWASTQTTAPTAFQAERLSPTSIRIFWTPITFTGETGGYRIRGTTTPLETPWPILDSTTDKTTSQLVLTGLTADTTYHFSITTFTNPHAQNLNTVLSEETASFTPPATLTLTSPNGSEHWRRGQVQAITWEARDCSGTVSLDLLQHGSLKGVIATGIPAADGTFSWTVGRLADGSWCTGADMTLRIRSEPPSP